MSREDKEQYIRLLNDYRKAIIELVNATKKRAAS